MIFLDAILVENSGKNVNSLHLTWWFLRMDAYNYYDWGDFT